jgi:hypothetical protein
VLHLFNDSPQAMRGPAVWWNPTSFEGLVATGSDRHFETLVSSKLSFILLQHLGFQPGQAVVS